MAEYRFEDLGDDGFQHMIQALLLHLHPDLSVPPIRQPDGGHDAFELQDGTGVKVFSYQVKWVRDQRQERDPVKWLKGIIKDEEHNLQRMQERGTKEWLLVTNVPGTAHEDTGRIDLLNAHLVEEGERFGMKMRAWWRNEVSRAVDSAPSELKFAYPDMLLGADIIRSITQTQFMIERKNRLSLILRAVAANQRGQDSEVRFKHGELEGVSLNSLFIDVPAAPVRRRSGAASAYFGSSTGVGLLTGLGHNDSTVILGAPGQGKSTLIQFICQVHRSVFLHADDDPMSAIGAAPLEDIPRIPYRIDLRIYARWMGGYDPLAGDDDATRREPGAPIGVESFIARMMHKDSGGAEVTPDDVLFLLDWLPSFVAFDGLDEVAEATTRQKVVDEIHAFQERSGSYRAETRIVVTARPSYASGAEPRDDKFSYFELLPLTDDLRNKYLERWSSSQKLTDQDAADVRRVFKARSAEPHVSELATNPMQLAILLFLIYRRGESVPTNRTALYASYMELFLDRETAKNDVVKRHRHTVERITAYIGWHLHADAESDGGTGRATRAELIRLVRYRLADLGLDPSLANTLFTAVTQRVWVITSRTDEYFEFEVQPIREYFAAKHLFTTAPASPSGKGVDRFDRMLALMHRPYWLNVTRFMAGMFDDGMISTVADKVEDLYESAPRPFWSRRVGKILLEDGVFDAAARPRRRIAAGAFDALGVVESEAVANPRPRRSSSYGQPSVEVIMDFLRTCLVNQTDAPLAYKCAKVLGAVSPSARGTLTWWNGEFDKTVDVTRRERWLELIFPLGIAKSITSAQGDGLSNCSPNSSLLLLEAGVGAENGSRLAAEFLELVVSGASTRPRGTSLAADLLSVCDAFFLFSRGAKNEAASPENELSLSHEEPPTFPRQSSALARMKSSPGLGERLHKILQITAGRRGTTLMWSQLANVIEDEFGANWLSTRIVISAAANRGLTKGIATRADQTDRSAFGQNRTASALLEVLFAKRSDGDWWVSSAGQLTSLEDREAWLLSLISCADDDTILSMLERAADVKASIPDASLKKIIDAIQEIARTRVPLSPYVVAVAANEFPDLACLMLPLCHLGALGFGPDATAAIAQNKLLVRTFVRAYWSAREPGTPVTEEELQLIAHCGPDFHFRTKALDFEQHVAEYVLSEPATYPTLVIAAADQALSASSKALSLRDIAEKEEWFVVPE